MKRRVGAEIARTVAALASSVVIATLAATALVVFAPGYGIDESALDPRLSGSAAGAPAADMYWSYLKALAQGDLGISSAFEAPVSTLLSSRIGVTARNVAQGLGLAWSGALSLALLGLVPAMRSVRPPAVAAGSLLLCVPSSLIALAAVVMKLSPAVAVAVVVFPRLHRYADQLLQASVSRPHVVAATARGVPRWRIIGNHIVRTSLPELIALAGVSVNIGLGASIPIEVLSDDPGLGQLAWRGALGRDVALVTGATLVIALATMTANRAAHLAIAVARRRT